MPAKVLGGRVWLLGLGLNVFRVSNKGWWLGFWWVGLR